MFSGFAVYQREREELLPPLREEPESELPPLRLLLLPEL